MKILYVTTISNTVNAFLIPHIRMLIDEGHQVDVSFNLVQEVKPEIFDMGCKVHRIPLQRSPFYHDNYKAFKMLKQIIISEKYDLVHTHTPVASAIVRLVCRNLNNVKVFYTAHGFHFYKGAPLINWIVYYPVEKWLSRYTDTIITINIEDYERAKSKFKARKIVYIPGVGIDLEKFNKVKIDKNQKRVDLGLPLDAFVILSVGELNKNKNHEVIIRAIARLNYPNIHYVICGKGPLEEYLMKVALSLGVETKVHLLGFRNDIAPICKSCNIFAFPSLREGLGLASLEAMACGLPLITSNVHGIVDYSINGVTGYNCNPRDIGGFVKNIEIYYKEFLENNNLHFREENIINKFNLSNVINTLGHLYFLEGELNEN